MYNFYDYIIFPKREEREKIKKTFFNALDLRLKKLIEEKTKKSLSKELVEKITIFNNNLAYLDLNILKMVNYYNLMKDSSDEEEKNIYQILFLFGCRDVSCEMFIYEEKIKDLLRFIYEFDKEEQKKFNNFYINLKKKSKKEHRKNFYKYLSQYKNNEEITAIKEIRNDEVHNSTDMVYIKREELIYYENLYRLFEKGLNIILELKQEFEKLLVEEYKDNIFKS